MLVYFEPAALCALQSDLILAPLPAKRQLWEALDEVAWKEESEREFQTSLGLAANGELVKLEEGEASYAAEVLLLHDCLDARTSSRRIANWEE